MSAPSIKSMVKDGTAKRADAVKFRIEDIHEEPGFNLRHEGEDLEASIDALAEHIAAGGMYPPLEVRPRNDGGVWLVDGHRRARAIRRVRDRIADAGGDVWVNVVAFTGNDADRIARVITSAEGRNLSPLEVAEGYRRLVAFGWTPAQIAAKVGKTSQHVGQLLALANADTGVQTLVRTGQVSATVALGAVREHGEAAAATLTAAVERAQAQGKSKATAGTLKPATAPRRFGDDALRAVAALRDALPIEAHETLATMNLSDAPTVTIPAGALYELLEIAREASEAAEAKGRKQREAEAAANQAEIEA